jgi:hypothetical protein
MRYGAARGVERRDQADKMYKWHKNQQCLQHIQSMSYVTFVPLLIDMRILQALAIKAFDRSGISAASLGEDTP